MPSPHANPAPALKAGAAQDPELALATRRLRDLYAQRLAWQRGQAMTLYLTPYSGFGPGLLPTEHWIGSSEDPDAHLLAIPLNALIDHYEQVLWLAGVPLP